MPILLKNIRPYLLPMGTRTSNATITFHKNMKLEEASSKAIETAIANFTAEHGYYPKESVFITVSFTSIQAIAEVAEFPYL